jgi:hypothetical protein
MESRLNSVLPVAGSQIFTVLSWLAVAACLPSARMAISQTMPWCSEKVLISLPLTASQIFAVPSRLHVAISFPSGLYATPSRGPL